MSELAFSINGERFRLPEGSRYWRPRRIKDRSLEVPYKANGVTPVLVGIEATEDDFQRELGYVAGKYRLDILDEHYQAIDGAPSAYVVIPDSARTSGAANEQTMKAAVSQSAPATLVAPGNTTEMGQLLREVVNVNAEVSRVIADRLSSVIEATATLIRAADGAGMPARPAAELPRNAASLGEIIREDVDTGGDDDEGSRTTWLDVLNNCFPYLDVLLGIRRGGPPRNANSGKRRNTEGDSTASTRSSSEKARGSTDTPPAADAQTDASANDNDAEPEVTPEMRAHFISIYARLSPDEAAFAREVAGELTPAELAYWMRELSSLSVEEAVERVRAKIAETNAGGGATVEAAS